MRALRLAALLVLAAACSGGEQPPLPTFEVTAGSALPGNGALGVPLDAQPSVTLNLAPDLVTAAGALTLSDGTTPVPGTSFIEGSSTLVFAPAAPLAPSTVYTATLAATVKGPQDQPLAAGFSWTFTTGVEAPPSRRPPLTIVSASPADGEDDVPLRSKVLVKFSRAMEPSVTSAVKLQKLTGRAIDAAVSLSDDGRTVSIEPSGLLGLESAYVVRVTSDAAAVDGTRLEAERRWTFHTTSDPTHGEALAVSSTLPADGAAEQALSTTVRITLSRPPLVSSVTAGTVRVQPAGTTDAVVSTIAVEPSQKTVTATPLAKLLPATTYEVVVSGIQSDEKLPMEPPEFRFTFTTSADPERGEHPRVTSVDPADGASGVAVTKAVVLTFSRPLDLSSFAVARPSLSVNGTPVSALPTLDPLGTTVTLKPYTPLPPDVDVTVSAPSGLRDSVDHLSLVPFVSSFHTFADHVPPTVTATSPADGAQDVETNTTITFTVSEDVRVPGPAISLSGPAGAVQGSSTYDQVTHTATFTPTYELDAQSDFTATLSGVQDIAGNALSGLASVTFHSGGAPDVTAPAFAGVASAIALDENHVRLSWSPGLDGRSAHLTYLVWVAEGATIDFSQPPNDTTAADATTFDVPNLAATHSYAFAVRAMDAARNVDANTVVVTATTPDLTPPAFNGISALSPVAGQAVLQASWNAASDNVTAPEAIAYRLYLSETPGGEVFTAAGRALETAAGASGALVTESRPGVPLVDGHTYYAVVRAVDAAGNETQSRSERAATVADVHPPVFTGTVTATATSSTAIRVSWEGATDNVDASSALTYRVSKRRLDEANFEAPESDFASGLFRNVTGLAADTTYVFRVDVRDRAGNVAANPQQPQAAGLDLSAPFFPNNDSQVQAAPGSAGHATVSWAAAVDNRTAAGSIVYLVYASTSASALFGATPITVTGQTTTDLGGLAGGTWFFGVRAKDGTGNVDGNTSIASATIVAP